MNIKIVYHEYNRHAPGLSVSGFLGPEQGATVSLYRVLGSPREKLVGYAKCAVRYSSMSY